MNFIEWGEDASDNVHIGFWAWHNVIPEGWVSYWSGCGVPVSLEAGDQKKVGIFPKNLIRMLIGTDGIMNILHTHWGDCDKGSILPLRIWWMNYFIGTWMVRCNPRVWNVHSLATENSEFWLINRTSNPLERINRKMNDSFPTPHPTLTSFVQTIRKISDHYVTDLAKITKGTTAIIASNVYHIPESYRSYMA